MERSESSEWQDVYNEEVQESLQASQEVESARGCRSESGSEDESESTSTQPRLKILRLRLNRHQSFRMLACWFFCSSILPSALSLVNVFLVTCFCKLRVLPKMSQFPRQDCSWFSYGLPEQCSKNMFFFKHPAARSSHQDHQSIENMLTSSSFLFYKHTQAGKETNGNSP